MWILTKFPSTGVYSSTSHGSIFSCQIIIFETTSRIELDIFSLKDFFSETDLDSFSKTSDSSSMRSNSGILISSRAFATFSYSASFPSLSLAKRLRDVSISGKLLFVRSKSKFSIRSVRLLISSYNFERVFKRLLDNSRYPLSMRRFLVSNCFKWPMISFSISS